MPRNFTAAAGYTQLDLLQFARDHLFAAEKLFGLGVRTLDSAGYLAQLGIELLLKALLLGATGAFRDEQSILKLCCKVKHVVPSFKIPEPYSDVLPLLDRYYELRYPAPRTCRVSLMVTGQSSNTSSA
jgi:HEPN domain-containing protein